MLNWIRQHPYFTLFGAMGLIFVFVGLEFLSMVEDVKIMLDVMNGKISVPAAPRVRGTSRPSKYSLNLLSRFSIPPKLADDAGMKIGPAWDRSSRLFPSSLSAADFYAQVASESALAEKIAVHLTAQVASLPACASLPANMDIGASTANYREARNHARFLVFLAREMALQGKRKHAWALACGPILLGYHLEVEETACAGLPLISRMISVAVRKIGSCALFELAPSLAIDRTMAHNTFDLLERIEAGLYPIMESLEQEASLLPGFAATLGRALETGVAHKTLSARPSLAMRSLSDPKRVKKRLDPIYDPLRAVNGKPWKDVASATLEITRVVDELQMKTSTPSAAWLAYVVSPSHLVLDFLIALSTPNFRKAIEQDYVCRQTTRGVGTAYVIAAYQNEFGRWPKTLSEAESWMKVRFPADLMTGDPIKYEITASGTPSLVSPGPDLRFGTSDDLAFLPFPKPVSNSDASEIEPHEP